MAITKLPENPLYKSAVDSAYRLGAALPKRAKRASKAIDTSQFRGVAQSVQKGPSARSLSELGTVTTPYGGSTKWEAKHPGIDIANQIGTPIPSTIGGRVTGVQTGQRQGDKGYGNFVIITDAFGNQHRYSHLNQNFVTLGQEVQPGQLLGGMGNTGQTYSLHGGDGSHLDYRIRSAYGVYMDPATFL